KMRLLGQRGLLGKTSCLLLDDTSVVPGASRTIWVDPEKDCSIVRYVARVGTSVVYQLDVEYQHDKEHKWVPNRWDYVTLDDRGQIKQAFHSRVTSWQINLVVDPNVFEIAFPPGTRVSEPKKSGTPEYILKDD